VPSMLLCSLPAGSIRIPCACRTRSGLSDPFNWERYEHRCSSRRNRRECVGLWSSAYSGVRIAQHVSAGMRRGRFRHICRPKVRELTSVVCRYAIAPAHEARVLA
jgi:hypothetical protein